MSWRRQLPAYSPLPLRAVLAGAAGLVLGAQEARRRVAAQIAHDLAADHVLLTDSGTSALSLALRAALAETPGASAALPAYGCYDLATAADGAGCPVLLYDVEPGTLAPDLDSLRKALTAGARAVVIAYWYGVPFDPGPILGAARESGALVIEDAAQGAGASFCGRPLGSFGDLTVLSFGRGKGITAGRGGALLSRGALGGAALSRAGARLGAPRRGFREMVQLKAQWLLGNPSLYALPASLPFLHLGETIYQRPSRARGMSAVAVRALHATWPLSEREAAIRRDRARRLLARVQGSLKPVTVPRGGEPGYLRLPLVAEQAVRSLVEAGGPQALGIMPGYPMALCDLPGFAQRVGDQSARCQGARLLAKGLLTLPTHGRLTADDLGRLESWLAQ